MMARYQGLGWGKYFLRRSSLKVIDKPQDLIFCYKVIHCWQFTQSLEHSSGHPLLVALLLEWYFLFIFSIGIFNPTSLERNHKVTIFDLKHSSIQAWSCCWKTRRKTKVQQMSKGDDFTGQLFEQSWQHCNQVSNRSHDRY